jgi:uncharacterized protein YrrD
MGMALVTVQEGIRLGTLKGVEFNAGDDAIRYLHFDGAGKRADGVIPWSSVRSVGKDAITVDSEISVQETIPVVERETVGPDIRSRPVLTEGGTHVGKVSGYEVDEVAGRIERYHVATGGLLGRLTHSEVVFGRNSIRAFGRDAIVIADDVLTGGATQPTEATT